MKFLKYFENIDSCYSFPPIVDENSRILILGTMPGKVSLTKGEYYSNRGNVFWKLISKIYNVEIPDNYEDKVQILLDNGIALWDVFKSCDRDGSLDSNIKNSYPNDFGRFFERYPNIEMIVFNGKNPRKIFKVETNKELVTLPSTSGANTHTSFTEKLDLWSVINHGMVNENFFKKDIDTKTVYYTQNFMDNDKVKGIMGVITPEWIKNNPVAFEVHKEKLYLTEGHHRFEASKRLNDKDILKSLFDSALYYHVNWKPRHFKKKTVKINRKL